MKILRIRSRINFNTLSCACDKKENVIIPVMQYGHNGEEHQFYLQICMEEVKRLDKDGSYFFKGQTVLVNGDEPVFVDGSISMMPLPNKANGHDYGHLAIYDD